MTRFVDITPHVSLLAKAGQSGHSVAEAVAELVDNAVDARVDGQPVTVDVTYDAMRRWIEVGDDGAGMSQSDLARALVMALSSKNGDRIGRFGLGLKTACTSLGPRFSVTSCTADGLYEAVATYDQDQFLETGQWRLPIKRQRKRRPRGTVVLVEDARVYNSLSQSLIRTLGWTFRHFIADELLILRVNGEVVHAPRHVLDEASVLPLYGEVLGRNVRGWVGLLTVSSQRGWYGFDLIRHRRVIRRHEKIGFQAHPQAARVVGELHLDDFETNNLKTDFIRETSEWQAVERWLSEVIEPVVAASRALAHSGSFDSRLRDLIAAERESVLAALGEHGLADLLEFRRLRPMKGAGSEAVSVVIGSFHVEHSFAWLDGDTFMRKELVTRPGETDVIRVETNYGYEPMTGDIASWACHNIAEAVALELVGEPDYLSIKSKIWAALARQRGLLKALRRSARTSRADRAFDAATETAANVSDKSRG